MNNIHLYSLMPRVTNYLLPAPKSEAEKLREKLNDYKETIKSNNSTIDTIKQSIAILNNRLVALVESNKETKELYKKSDRKLARLDGRYKVVKLGKFNKSVKDQLKKFNQDQLAQISTALNQLMKDQKEN